MTFSIEERYTQSPSGAGESIRVHKSYENVKLINKTTKSSLCNCHALRIINSNTQEIGKAKKRKRKKKETFRQTCYNNNNEPIERLKSNYRINS